LTPYAGLANRCLQPLGHHSSYFRAKNLTSSALLAKPLALAAFDFLSYRWAPPGQMR
jgi:hypothetical protein